MIRNLSILDHPLVRDLLAYLRLIVKPADNVACARVLAAPAWGLEPADLVRLCERAAQSQELAVGRAASAAGRTAFQRRAAPRAPTNWWPGSTRLREQSATSRRRRNCSTRWPNGSSCRWRSRPTTAATSTAWRNSCANGRRRAKPRGWRNSCEYLDYFAQAGGQINLEQEAGDAVQLMTVHAAKGLEFDHVFVLRLTQRGFPMAPRTARAGISRSVDEGRAAEGRLPHAGGAAAVLRGDHAGARAADADHGGAQALAGLRCFWTTF